MADGFNLSELASILTHFFLLPALVISWRHADYFGLTLFFVVVSLLDSIFMHTCALVGEFSLCLFEFPVLQLMDHISAELLLLVAAILLARFQTLLFRTQTMAFSAWLLMFCKLKLDSVWFLVVLIGCFCPFILYRNRGVPKRHPWKVAFALYMGGLAFFFYFLDFGYEVAHPIWHATGFIAYDLVIAIVHLETRPPPPAVLPYAKLRDELSDRSNKLKVLAPYLT